MGGKNKKGTYMYIYVCMCVCINIYTYVPSVSCQWQQRARVESIMERWLFQFIRSTAGPMAGEEKVWLSAGSVGGAEGRRLQ